MNSKLTMIVLAIAIGWMLYAVLTPLVENAPVNPIVKALQHA